jgi:hypothetical protein
MSDIIQIAYRVNGTFNSVYPTTEITGLVPTEKLDVCRVRSAMRKIAQENKDYFRRGYVGVFTAPDGEKYFMSTNINGLIFVNFAQKDGFDAGTSLVSAFEKLEKGVALTQNEEYSIEVLWHEILHNKSKNTAILPPIDAIDVGFQRMVAETVNQLVARHTYPDFLSKLGGTAAHKDWILSNGYGYSATVNNLRSLLSTLNINEKDFVREANIVLMEDYSNIDDKIRDIAMKISKRKDSWKVKESFNMLEHDDFDNFLKIFKST